MKATSALTACSCRLAMVYQNARYGHRHTIQFIPDRSIRADGSHCSWRPWRRSAATASPDTPHRRCSLAGPLGPVRWGPNRSYLADTVRLGYVENAGGFLSLGADLPPVARTAVFSVGTGLALVALIATAVRKRHGSLPVLGLVLFVAGGSSNWIDRIARGSVVDFLNISAWAPSEQGYSTSRTSRSWLAQGSSSLGSSEGAERHDQSSVLVL